MNTAGIKSEDVVEVDIRGDRFMAVVTAKGKAEDARLKPREIMVRPVCTGRTIRIVTARQIVAHWRKAGRNSTK